MLGTISPRGVAAAIPRLTECLSTISWAASSQAELSSGVRCRAPQTTLAMINIGVILTSRNSRRAFSRSTSSIVAETSMVTHSVTCGAVNADSTMAFAVALRTPLIGIRLSRNLAGQRSVGDEPWLDPPGPRTASDASTTSSRVITPPGPLPRSAFRSTPRSLASLRTGGLASTAPAPRDGRRWRRQLAGIRQRAADRFGLVGRQRLALIGTSRDRHVGGEGSRGDLLVCRLADRVGRSPLRGRRLASVVFGP